MTLLRTTSLLFANILLPIAVIIFATGFFPYKPVLPGLATFEDVEAREEIGFLAEWERPSRVFDKVVFMVVDALRSDFVFGHESGFEFTQSLIRSGSAMPFTAHATPPTITMPRVKALTTGSVPSFLDVILNFAESDTSSSLAAQDTWLAQIRAHLHGPAGKGEEGRLVFYGDDTWLKLFPSFFAQHDGTSSFFVSDFTEVDNNVTRHLTSTLEASASWDALILHYLGLDHIGHKSGPQSPNMLPKQREMDASVREIYTAISTQPNMQETLLVLVGDHGMNSAGNHGGSAPGETSAALVFASPKFRDLARSGGAKGYEAPTRPRSGTEFAFYRQVEQSDVVPTLAGLLGVPMPRNNLGVFIPEMLRFWSPSVDENGNERKQSPMANGGLQVLYRNALQVLEVVVATFGEVGFTKIMGATMGYRPCSKHWPPKTRLSCKWSMAQRMLVVSDVKNQFTHAELETALNSFLIEAQDVLSTTASSYNVRRMVSGAAVAGLATIFALCSLKPRWLLSAPGLAFGAMSLLYGVMMFASSYVEEEQHFWYWTTGAWIVFLCAKRMGNVDQKSAVAVSGIALLALHRICIRWNQTGQKHAGEPDIARTFLPDHHILLWILVIATYVHLGVRLVRRSLADILGIEFAISGAVSVTLAAFVFKLNFTQADAPELVQGLARRIREWSEPFDLVQQARAVFLALGMVTVVVVAVTLGVQRFQKLQRGSPAFQTTLAERLHDLLTVFLVTQTRVQNVPLFLIFESQLQLLTKLTTRISPPTPTSKQTNKDEIDTSLITVTALLFTHTSYFCMGGSNAISSIDLSNAYNGVSGYNVGAVGVLLYCSNWAGPIWWSSAAVLLLRRLQRAERPQKASGPAPNGREWVSAEREKLRQDAKGKDPSAASSKLETSPGLWRDHVAVLTVFVAFSLVAVMVACTFLRTHLFIWTVFSPKYLYAMAWSVAWHLGVNVGLGRLLHMLGRPVHG